jgi:hypothetical protein
MKEKIKWFFKNLIDALFNDKNGFSLRKTIAAFIAQVSIILEIAYTTPENLLSILIANFSFIGLLIGIVTTQNIIELKNGAAPKN